MTVALFDPCGGIAGDMTVAALLDLGFPLALLREQLGALRLSGYTVSSEEVWRGPFRATHFKVLVEEHDHPHRHLSEVTGIVAGGRLPARVAERSLRVFQALAEAEGAVHGVPPEEVHFHEVGAIDAIVDVVSCSLGLEYLGVDRVLTTRVRAGTGEVTCAHGKIPVPGPAVVRLLTGFPLALAEGEGETVTPTGAAILGALAKPVAGDQPFTVARCGVGAGTRDDTARPNVLRVMLGEAGARAIGRDEVVEIEANLDDQTPEVSGHAAARLVAAGALDAFLTPVLMKKGRPGVVLTVLARPEDEARLVEMVFRETTTFGVRRATKERAVLDRRHEESATPWGKVRVKLGILRGEVVTRSPEYEDCARLAAEAGVAVRAVYDAALHRGADRNEPISRQ